MIANLLGGWASQGRYQNFLNNYLLPNNQVGIDALKGAGFGSGFNQQTAANNLSANGQSLSSQLYSPTQISAGLSQNFGNIGNQLGALPGQIAGQQSSALGAFRNAGANLQGNFGAGAAGINAGYGNLANNINAGYQGELQTARGLVNARSTQDITDTNRFYDQQNSAQQANLLSRGLGSSTITASTANQTNRDRTGALNRLSDQRLQQQLGVEGTFGLGALQAQQALGQNALQARTGLLGAQTDLGASLSGTQLTGGMNAASLNAQTGMNALGQQMNLGQFGFNALDAGKQQRLSNLYNFGQLPINTASGLLGQGINFYGPQIQLPYPQPFQPISIQPRG